MYWIECTSVSYLWKDTSEADVGYVWGEEIGERETFQ